MSHVESTSRFVSAGQPLLACPRHSWGAPLSIAQPVHRGGTEGRAPRASAHLLTTPPSPAAPPLPLPPLWAPLTSFDSLGPASAWAQHQLGPQEGGSVTQTPLVVGSNRMRG
eukprot:7388461-Prymnesium_polylepis.2